MNESVDKDKRVVSTGEESLATAPEVLTETVDIRDQDWASLIERMAGGDEYALSSFYDRSSRLIFGLLLRILGDTGMAGEVLLDVYMQVWRQAAKYDRSRGKTLAWIVTIARSRAIDRLRSSRQEELRKESLDAKDHGIRLTTTFEDPTIAPERQKVVRAALDSLPPEQREVIEMAYYLGLSHSEIAARLGQPLGTVKTRTRLGMIKLREQLKDSYRGVL
ncbi:MAG TPA: sigma-70 family RNA polymerase sigma factor [Pyrinomonadaceae bacterium]|nr:sigma-70 family RNA polymerase sigma factor [Pyrinomonadaceae bacterium]